ncbi:MAG: hypothetical protein J6Z50_05255 [Fibrobacterales bacterium]|nr:hypothetical protein [Fibrobacterales bacterium]MBP5188521.1 hypothetical protein [Fibrobacterales bacterium]MBP5350362.1 hypothetical protein [Fibrobacterales bacterium]
MKKMLTVLAAVAFLATAAFAQEEGSAPASNGGSQFQIAPEFGISYYLGNDDGFDDIGLGFPAITVKALYNLNNVKVAAGPLAVGAWVGYVRDYSDSENGADVSLYTIPLILVAEFRLIEQLWLDAGIGFAIVGYSMDVPYLGEMSDSETRLSLMARAGYDIIQAGPGTLQASVGFQFIDDYSKLLVQVGYNFAL